MTGPGHRHAPLPDETKAPKDLREPSQADRWRAARLDHTANTAPWLPDVTIAA